MPVKYFEKIRRAIDLAPGAEWTIEANPKTLSSYDLLALKDFGVNRLSVGMQSFSDSELAWLGRNHTAKDAIDLIEAAAKIGMRVSADFMYGWDGCDVKEMCRQINELPIEHASLYELTIEPGTPFSVSRYHDYHEGEARYHDYQTIQEHLRLPRYEVSNYGKPCEHNANIWAGEEYIGIGESAAGRIQLTVNSEQVTDAWCETRIENNEIITSPLSDYDRAIEMVMTGLRTMRGVDVAALPAGVINWDFVKNNLKFIIAEQPTQLVTPLRPGVHCCQGDSNFEIINCLQATDPGLRRGDGCEETRFLKMTDSGLLVLDSLLVDIIK